MDTPTLGYVDSSVGPNMRQLSVNGDCADVDRCIELLSQGLSRDVLVAYFTRDDPTITAQVWEDQLRRTSRVNPAAKQFFCLGEFSAAAFTIEYPRDSPSTWTTMLGLMPIVPMTKWRALAEWIASKDKQKTAFSRAHGPFIYLMAFSDASGRQESDACATVVQAVFKAADATQQVVYVEARPKQRSWLKTQGFGDMMGYKVRKSEKAPQIYIMYRSPTPPPAVLPRR